MKNLFIKCIWPQEGESDSEVNNIIDFIGAFTAGLTLSGLAFRLMKLTGQF